MSIKDKNYGLPGIIEGTRVSEYELGKKVFTLIS